VQLARVPIVWDLTIARPLLNSGGRMAAGRLAREGRSPSARESLRRTGLRGSTFPAPNEADAVRRSDLRLGELVPRLDVP
jgi:hypothetical protein